MSEGNIPPTLANMGHGDVTIEGERMRGARAVTQEGEMNVSEPEKNPE